MKVELRWLRLTHLAADLMAKFGPVSVPVGPELTWNTAKRVFKTILVEIPELPKDNETAIDIWNKKTKLKFTAYYSNLELCWSGRVWAKPTTGLRVFGRHGAQDGWALRGIKGLAWSFKAWLLEWLLLTGWYSKASFLEWIHAWSADCNTQEANDDQLAYKSRFTEMSCAYQLNVFWLWLCSMATEKSIFP